MWTGTRSSRFYVVELKDQLWAGSSHIGLVWFWDICLGLPVQVYALGGFMVLSWLWGRWKERRDRRASPWGLSSSMSPGGDCSIIPSLQLAFPSPSSLPSARHFLFEGCCLSHFFQSIRSPMDSSSRRWEGQRYGCLLTSFDCCSRDPSACIILVAMTSGFGAGGGGRGLRDPPLAD